MMDLNPPITFIHTDLRRDVIHVQLKARLNRKWDTNQPALAFRRNRRAGSANVTGDGLTGHRNTPPPLGKAHRGDDNRA